MKGLLPLQPLAPGSAYPLGASWDGDGVNFAVFAGAADSVELCLFDEAGRLETRRGALPECTDGVWHGYLAGAGPGLAYGYRAHGPYRPSDGLRFNPHKLLLDPYARDLVGALDPNGALYGYATRDGDVSPDHRDSAPWVPKGRVVAPDFDWGDDRTPATPWSDTVIYELNVRGFTRLHPEVPEALRGSYAALGSPPIVDYLKRLGVTAVELLPVHASVNERRLHDQQLQNLWGYNTLGFFVPEPRYSASASGPVAEFKTMVKSLHAAGIEVILDVVYNHTGEGDALGPTLSLRGLDNAAYYVLDASDPSRYTDHTGCGNTVNVAHPRALQLVMDSLRYWVDEMHVDGFRFDLATTLAREGGDFAGSGSFFKAVLQDPTLARVKLIAEPWDLGPDGYQVGRFPPGWSEWNDRYRDGVRSYWRGDGGRVADLAKRLTGSPDLHVRAGKRPQASINFVTAHDGFTLHDLVSYRDKHNLANGENNRDGSDHSLSWNCGVEGPTDDPATRRLRARQKRNLLATLLLSQGVPMLLAGDERGRTQHGNNNAYCQDNPIGWVDWSIDSSDADGAALTEFTRRVIALRAAHPTFRRRRFLSSEAAGSNALPAVRWLRPDGLDKEPGDWANGYARCIGMALAGGEVGDLGAGGESITDDDFLLLFNAHHEPLPFTLPKGPGGDWRVVLDTRPATGEAVDAPPVAAGSTLELGAQSLCVLQREAAR